MDFRELLDHRRSTRAYTGEPVTREQLDLMLEAGVRAPNACNAQCWHFFCTLDRKLIEGLVPEIYNRGDWLKDVGCIILICTDPDSLVPRFGEIVRERFAVQDTAAAATQILQCATTLGLAGCWMGAFDREKARTYFGVPAEMEPVIMLGIGHAAAEPPARPRKPMADVVTMVGDCGTAEKRSADEITPFAIRKASLPKAEFDNVNLSGATFNNINLSGAAFTDANMKNTTYGGLTMQGAKFSCVDLQDATFANPDLSRTVFDGCSLRDVQIKNCDISGLTVEGIAVDALIEAAKKKD